MTLYAWIYYGGFWVMFALALFACRGWHKANETARECLDGWQRANNLLRIVADALPRSGNHDRSDQAAVTAATETIREALDMLDVLAEYAGISLKQPPDEVFRHFQRLHGLPKVGGRCPAYATCPKCGGSLSAALAGSVAAGSGEE